MEAKTTYHITTDVQKCKADGVNYLLISHAVMGLISHFKNRDWASGHAYMYIQKSVQFIDIKDKYFADFLKRIEQMGASKYVSVDLFNKTNEEGDVTKYNGTEQEGEDYDEDWEHRAMTKGMQ